MLKTSKLNPSLVEPQWVLVADFAVQVPLYLLASPQSKLASCLFLRSTEYSTVRFSGICMITYSGFCALAQ